MITALRMAKLRACNALLEAKDKVLDTRPLVCWKDQEVREIDRLVEQLDALLHKVLP